MAEQIIRVLTDDLDGSTDAERFSFAYQGISYEIDLAKGNAEKFEKVLAPYLEAARNVRRSNARRGVRGSSSGTVPTNVVRDWAQSNGIKISTRGRIPADVMQQYTESH